MLTKEEKEKRKQERIKDRKEEAKKFPGCHYAPSDIQLILEAGRAWGLEIRTNKLDQFKKDYIGGDSGWVRASVPLDDIRALASLVHALSARLKVLIEDANDHIREIGIPELLPPAPSHPEAAQEERTK